MAHPKGLLIERAQRLGLARPEFDTARTGPEHEPSFLSDVTVDGELLGTGQGGSKREAERRAAEEALSALDKRAGGSAGAKPAGAKATGTKAASADQPPTDEDGAAKASGGKRAAKDGKAADTAKAAKGARGANEATAKGPAKEALAKRPAKGAEPKAAPTGGRRPADDRQARVGPDVATSKGGAAEPVATALAQPAPAAVPEREDPEPFTGPWPMIDDVLASVITVAERRVSADLRGETALVAIRDFALRLYKDMLADLGEVVDEDEEDEEDEQE